MRPTFIALLLLCGAASVGQGQAASGRQPVRLPLELLPDTLAMCRLAPEASVPAWASRPGGFLTISRSADELSIMAVQRAIPPDTRCERDYRALRVHGSLPPNLVGILESILKPLADAGLGILAISTYETDYVFVKTRDLGTALEALRAAGYTITP